MDLIPTPQSPQNTSNQTHIGQKYEGEEIETAQYPQESPEGRKSVHAQVYQSHNVGSTSKADRHPLPANRPGRQYKFVHETPSTINFKDIEPPDSFTWVTIPAEIRSWEVMVPLPGGIGKLAQSPKPIKGKLKKSKTTSGIIGSSSVPQGSHVQNNSSPTRGLTEPSTSYNSNGMMPSVPPISPYPPNSYEQFIQDASNQIQHAFQQQSPRDEKGANNQYQQSQ